MSWIILSCIPPFLWAFNNIFDEYLSKSTFAKAGALFIFMSASFDALGSLFVLPFVENVMAPDVFSILIMMTLGLFISISFVPYIFAMQEDNASNVIPIFQTIPVFVFVLGYVFLGESASIIQIFGAAIIVIAAVMIGFDFKAKSINKKAVKLMLICCLMIAIISVMLKPYIENYGWATYTYWSWLGSGIGSILLICLVSAWRQKAVCIMKTEKRLIVIIFFLQIMSQMTAIMVWNKAVSIGPSVALVQTLNGLQPAFVLVLTVIAGMLSIKIFPKVKFDRYLLFKFLMLMPIIIGIYFLSL